MARVTLTFEYEEDKWLKAAQYTDRRISEVDEDDAIEVIVGAIKSQFLSSLVSVEQEGYGGLRNAWVSLYERSYEQDDDEPDDDD